MSGIVLLAGGYYPDQVGGTEAYVRALAKDLQSLGTAVHVAAPVDGREPRSYEEEGVPVFRYPVVPDPTRAEVRGRAEPLDLEVFTRWLAEIRPRLVHMHSYTRGCGIHHARAVERLGLPLVVTVHVPGVTCPRGTLMRWGKVPCDGRHLPVRCSACRLQSAGVPRAAAWPIALLSGVAGLPDMPGRLGTAVRFRALEAERRQDMVELFSIADRVIAVSDWLAEVLRRNGVPSEKLVTSAHGIPGSAYHSDPRRPPAVPRAPLRVGFVGRIDPVKGLHVLTRAVRSLPDAVALELHVFGRVQGADNRAYARRLEQTAAADPRICFRGEAHGDTYREFDVLAVPSLWFEAGPLVVLEAFAAGLPVIGSDRGGIAERVSHGKSGVLVPAGDTAAWARQLEGLWRRFTAGEWAWELPPVRASIDVAREMRTIYDGLLDVAVPVAAAGVHADD